MNKEARGSRIGKTLGTILWFLLNGLALLTIDSFQSRSSKYMNCVVGKGPLSARDRVASLADVGEGSREDKKERKPVALAGGLMMKPREYSFPGEGSRVPRNSYLCAQGDGMLRGCGGT